MANLNEMFASDMENDGILTHESALLGIEDSDALLNTICNRADEDAEVLTIESALNDLDNLEKGWEVITKIDEMIVIAKEQSANGTVTHETAIKLSAGIDAELSKFGGSLDAYLGETVTFESASNQPQDTVDKIIASFDAEEVTHETAGEYLDKAKNYVASKAQQGKEFAVTQYRKFKAWLIKIYNKVKVYLKDLQVAAFNMFSSDAKVIDRLIADCDAHTDAIKKDAKLTVKDFKGTFPYLADHKNAQLDALTGRWSSDGDVIVALGQDLIAFSFENGYSPKTMEEVTKRVQTNIISKMKEIPGTNRKGIVLTYPGIEIKALVPDAANLFKVESIKGKEVSLTKTIAPLSLKEIKDNLTSLKSKNSEVSKVLKKFPDAIKKLEGATPKDSIGFKYISAGLKAITEYSKGASKTVKAFIALNAKHLQVHERA